MESPNSPVFSRKRHQSPSNHPPIGKKRSSGATGRSDPKIPPSKRVQEYPGECLSVSPTGRLFCTACREIISVKRSTIVNHTRSLKHAEKKKQFMENGSCQRDIVKLLTQSEPQSSLEEEGFYFQKEEGEGFVQEHNVYPRGLIQEAAKDFVSFVNKGPSPFHVVDECKRRLVAGGFSELKEKDPWKISPGGKYYIINNFSTIIAFAVGAKYQPGNGFSIVAAHTDSPCLKVKPRSVRTSCGFLGVGVQLYGGGIWHSWFDRDLKLAGRVVYKSPSGLVHRLVHIEEPILRVPNICIHLERDMNDAFSPNKERHTGIPVLATVVQAELEKVDTSTKDSAHHPILMSLLSKKADCSPSDIVEFELCLADTQPATIGGALEEFIFAPRIDNLMNCYTGLQGLLDGMDTLDNETNIRMLALFDNEEVGSQSAQGAMSSIVEWTLRRIAASGADSYGVAFEESVPKSLIVSADQAHAIHPNYAEKHEINHRPGLHKGIVLKYNSNQRYATTAITAAIMKEIAARSGVPIQEVAVRNDSGCGSTIGPLMSAKLGMRTVDIGTPQLSMHSIREMCCTTGVSQACRLYKFSPLEAMSPSTALILPIRQFEGTRKNQVLLMSEMDPHYTITERSFSINGVNGKSFAGQISRYNVIPKDTQKKKTGLSC